MGVEPTMHHDACLLAFWRSVKSRRRRLARENQRCLLACLMEVREKPPKTAHKGQAYPPPLRRERFPRPPNSPSSTAQMGTDQHQHPAGPIRPQSGKMHRWWRASGIRTALRWNVQMVNTITSFNNVLQWSWWNLLPASFARICQNRISFWQIRGVSLM